jgi:hypothetical protein
MEPEPSRFAIARAHSSRDRASAKRLEAAWKERDAMLNGGEPQGTSSPEEETEGYPCPHCDEVLPGPPTLAAHVRHQHPRRGRPKAPGRRSNGRRRVRAAANGGVPCPMCCQALPPTVGVLAGQFEREGLEEEVALRCAALAWAGLRVP